MAKTPANTLTEILQGAKCDDQGVTDRVLPLVYEELRRMARKQLAHEMPGQTLQPTALVHEAYLRLVGSQPLQWESRGHFFAAAAISMRRILVERARTKKASKRTPGGRRRSLDHAVMTPDEIPAEELLALDDALAQLQNRDARKAQVVNLKFFAGLSNQETATALGVSITTIKDDWQFARAWLHREMSRHDG